MTDAKPTANFIRNIIDEDLKNNKNDGRVVTRFPPEPNGYLHIGHAKSICLNFGMAQQYGGSCNLRFDDTNPVKEDVEYSEAIKADVSWLGFEWNELRHASDYFDQLYDFAVQLIKAGKAYVESSTAEELREMRGTLKEPGKPSPYRDRSVEENLDLFERMKNGEFVKLSTCVPGTNGRSTRCTTTRTVFQMRSKISLTHYVPLSLRIIALYTTGYSTSYKRLATHNKSNLHACRLSILY